MIPTNNMHIVTEIIFSGKSLADCLHQIAEWLDKYDKRSPYSIVQDVHLQQDSEYPDWYGTLYCSGDLIKESEKK